MEEQENIAPTKGVTAENETDEKQSTNKVQKNKDKVEKCLHKVKNGWKSMSKSLKTKAKQLNPRLGTMRPKSKVKIFECMLPGCNNKFHGDQNTFKDHLINNHLKASLLASLKKHQDTADDEDPRMCPFVPCGFFAPFRYSYNAHA